MLVLSVNAYFLINIFFRKGVVMEFFFKLFLFEICCILLYFFTGVDLNQAPTFLLRHVTGISAKIAEKIVEKRHQFGGFRSRQDLLKIKGLGPKTFEQCAGFLNIFPGEEFE